MLILGDSLDVSFDSVSASFLDLACRGLAGPVLAVQQVGEAAQEGGQAAHSGGGRGVGAVTQHQLLPPARTLGEISNGRPIKSPVPCLYEPLPPGPDPRLPRPGVLRHHCLGLAPQLLPLSLHSPQAGLHVGAEAGEVPHRSAAGSIQCSY